MSKPRPDKLLKFLPLLGMLLAEPFRVWHEHHLERHTCLDLAGTYPVCCAISGAPLTHCNGRRRG